MNQRREKEGVVIPTFDMHIYTTHRLKLGMDQRREKEGVVIPKHAHLQNSPAKVGNGSEKRKRGSGYS